MPSFTDDQGRDWPIKITLTTTEEFYSATKEDLLQVESGDEPLIARLAAGSVLMTRLLWCICSSLAGSRGVKRSEFIESISGEAFPKAQGAVLEALENFTRCLGQTARSEIVAKARSEILSRLSAQKGSDTGGGSG